MKSEFLTVTQNKRGAITKLQLNSDKSNMNWVIDPEYLESLGYDDLDKLFGEFNITVNGQKHRSIDQIPRVSGDDTHSTIEFKVGDLSLVQEFKLIGNSFKWDFTVKNNGQEDVTVNNLGVWVSLAYVMFRDKNVKRNANQSVAVFPQISKNYTKLAAVRRDNTSPNMGLYQTKGEVLSVGTFNDYTNRFFENVSPSLDGMLFHEIVLAGGYDDDRRPHNDWIYPQNSLVIKPGESRDWEFYLKPYTTQKDFYDIATNYYNHPRFAFEPMISQGAYQVFNIKLAKGQNLKRISVRHKSGTHIIDQDMTDQLENGRLVYEPQGLGEHQVVLEFDDGTVDMGVFNVMNSINELLQNRADYVSEHSYAGADGKVPYSFGPVSNQGESIGKMTFILQECLLDDKVENADKQIAQVEESAVKYVRPKWFENGDFKKPAKLYGDFYRLMDLEYIAHMFYLLSKCPASALKLNQPNDYLSWAAQVFDVRVNPDLNDNERGKTEAQMLGTYGLYIEDLLADLKKSGLDKEYSEISKSWKNVTDRLAANSDSLEAAMTEHFFDNAGFGPAAGALALTGNTHAAMTYGELLKANIGFSNDFRSQSPDRWWEALSYMIHALWGGLTAASAQIAGEKLQDPELVEAAYRATGAVLYMYDSNATATDRMLEPGDAASTYSIAGPNLNRPDLSRNRFGQSIFASDGGIFARLFPDGYTGEDDWDMGEELVAFLNGFGQKTYIYKDPDKGLTAVNGRVKKLVDNHYEIQSFAPYISEYIYLDDNQVFESHKDKALFNLATRKFE
ncbi:hypothetical protein ABC628_04810 [Lentilactobacillus otakiensis]|uniref:Uncharacterized protein n=1 Tax=Lentilactobacillus otakiensis DSM 19908 = JCM 15040 TaxID=1423780 RepID=S4NIT2_9LACO|nr:hypothetical protein [Lentilactobacillus otakiensis]KRL12122.1 hypothetical protein FD05_GL001958 [Lentilactobacillus otakiensis DSM 19908 = JCM 15040]MBZ3777570.1 hypothetical protein [Lentilactobacillus otakiensis]MDV3519395.1 hypothetical protein [Lentilactobacillus otakiensis]GAD17167.1 conserved hypothetical protein [Lentilactobacillus otakiensis DSM 19908 = JCM 15040]